MEKIVKTTYKIYPIEYCNHGWQGTAEMDCSEFETFDRAALLELLCKMILQTVIDDYIDESCTISDSRWESLQYNIEHFIKGDTIISELFPIVKFENIQYDEDDEGEIRCFGIILSKNISPITCENIYLTFEY